MPCESVKSWFMCIEFVRVFLMKPLPLSMLQPKEEEEEEEPSGDKVLESDQEKMSHGLQLEREPLELKPVKAVEENGEQEAEPVRNGAESISEGEGTDANSGCTESSGEGPVYQCKPGKFCSTLLLCLPPVRAADTHVSSLHMFPLGLGGDSIFALCSSAEISNPAGPERSSSGGKRGKLFLSCW